MATQITRVANRSDPVCWTQATVSPTRTLSVPILPSSPCSLHSSHTCSW
jgi:hypothetical protein